MRTTVLVYDLDGFHAHLEFVEPADEQDYLDGAAIRRLREALPHAPIKVMIDAVAYGTQVAVHVLHGSRDGYAAIDDTIAKAADACREGLTKD